MSFASGHEVLSSYWGYLSDGGLVVDDDNALDYGDEVVLTVEILSTNTTHLLSGKVVRRQPDSAHAVVAFHPGQPHDLLLSQALAETDKVPARRHRRYRIELDATLRRAEESPAPQSELPGQLTNISREGCCVRLRESSSRAHPVGSLLRIETGDFSVRGEVMWQRSTDRGVRFELGVAAASSLALLQQYLRNIAVRNVTNITTDQPG